MTDIVTCDLSDFGYSEIAKAGELLNAYAEHGAPEFLGSGITINMNKNSGYVFLSDEDYNVGVLEQDAIGSDPKIVQFYSCPNCGNEGTQEDGISEDWDFEKYNGYCTRKCENA